MQQADPVLTVMPDMLSSGMYREITGTAEERMETLHQRLISLRVLIGLLRDVDYDDNRVDDMLASIEAQIDACAMLSGDEARLVGALPVGFDTLWNRPSYALARQEGRL